MKVLMLIVPLLLVGCGEKVQIVRVPVPIQAPAPEIPPKPVLRTGTISDSASDKEFIMSQELDLSDLMSYSDKLINMLEVYKKGIPQEVIDSIMLKFTTKKE